MGAPELHLHGLIEGMSNADYHAAAGVSKSQLDKMAESPLAFWDAYENPDREPQETKHCFAVGDGTHKLVLEPGTFQHTYAVGFDKSAFPNALDLVADLKRECTARGLMVSGTKGELVDRLIDDGFDAKRIMLVLEREHAKTMAGRIPISAIDYKHMLNMLTAISRHHSAPGLIEGAFVEQSYFVSVDVGVILGELYDPRLHGDDQILLKCRPDIITANGQIIADLKTTDEVGKAAFGRTIVQRAYDVQASLYLDILRWLLGSDAPRFFAFIPAQKRRPYDVSVLPMEDWQVARGRAIYQRLLARLVECRRTNYWPGADDGRVEPPVFPTWATNDLAVF